MFAVRRFSLLLLILFSLILMSACQEESSSATKAGSRTIGKDFQWKPLFGDGANDASATVARVGDIEITARDLELYLDELPPAQQNDYVGPEGKHLLLKRMVETLLFVQGAADKKLFNDPDVARTIIAQRRNTMHTAMINYGLLRDKKPTEDELREYFRNHRDTYRQMGVVNARHVECMTKEDADKAFQRLTAGGKGNEWSTVMMEMSVNKESKELDGSVGWFNQGGIIPYIAGSENFSQVAYDLDMGLNLPFKVVNRWHVVEILSRENSRPATFSEAKNKVELDMMPAWQDAIIKDYLQQARKDYPVELLGDYAPGKGLTADELFARALSVADGEKKIELLNLIHTDYAGSQRADDALFLAATVALDTWSDVRVAERYLRLLLEEYPDSELIEDAKFLKDNLYNPEVLNPKSMDDIRK